MPAPIALFVYSRPDHTRRTLTALAANPLALKSDLFVFADGAKTHAAEAGVNAVRSLLADIVGFRSVTVIERDRNWGLAASIIDGVTQLCEQFGQVIVVEDDLVTSPHFLSYLNDGLRLYRDEPRVASIHAYSYPAPGLPETYFLRGADCWGWATWKRAWDHFNPDGKALQSRLHAAGSTHDFDLDGAYNFSGMLQDQIEGRVNSWAIRWHASAYLDNLLTLYPGKSLVLNIGNDGSGTHCEATSLYTGVLDEQAPVLGGIEIDENRAARRVIATYFLSQRPSILRRILRKLRKIFPVPFL